MYNAYCPYLILIKASVQSVELFCLKSARFYGTLYHRRSGHTQAGIQYPVIKDYWVLIISPISGKSNSVL